MEIDATVAELNFAIEVAQCKPSLKIRDVRTLLQESRIGSVIISERSKVAGIFTERDYLMKIAGKEDELDDRTVKEFMTANPKSVDSQTKIVDIIKLMKDGHFRHMIILEPDGKLRGVVSIRDLLGYLLDAMTDMEKSLKDLASVFL